MKRQYEIQTLDGALITWGLARSGQPELRLRPHRGSREAVLYALIKKAADYSLQKNEPLQNGEKIPLMSWVFRLREQAGFLELDELSRDGRQFVKGCAFAERLIAAQTLVCRKLGAQPRFARTDELVVVSEDVLSGGRPIEGVRYSSPAQMSGWRLTTEAYNGDAKTLITVHMGNVIMARKDICAILALPYGYRFRIAAETNAWFDPEAATGMSEN